MVRKAGELLGHVSSTPPKARAFFSIQLISASAASTVPYFTDARHLQLAPSHSPRFPRISHYMALQLSQFLLPPKAQGGWGNKWCGGAVFLSSFPRRQKRALFQYPAQGGALLPATMPWSQPWYVVRRIVGGSLLYTRTTELSVWGRAFVPCVLLQALLTVGLSLSLVVIAADCRVSILLALLTLAVLAAAYFAVEAVRTENAYQLVAYALASAAGSSSSHQCSVSCESCSA